MNKIRREELYVFKLLRFRFRAYNELLFMLIESSFYKSGLLMLLSIKKSTLREHIKIGPSDDD